jgi:serine/threonine protein kinase
MGNKQGRGIKGEGIRTGGVSAKVMDGEAIAAKIGGTNIDYDHFASDPNMVDIAEEIAMVSAKIDIEDFKILKLLGKGTYGKVMLVQHKDEGTLFALKTLRKNKVIKSSQIEHTRSERKYLY